jgi:two-component system, OmpR family, KDP operon response regulator KdpE
MPMQRRPVPAGVSPLALVIEHELPMRRFLRTTLEQHGYRVVEAASAREGTAQATGRNPDVILLDLGLPDGDDIALTRQFREWATTPIIVISARGREQDKIAALDAGADDYLTKPFGTGELMARLRVALRHSEQVKDRRPEPAFGVGDLRVDLDARRVFVADAEIHLTPTEYKLLVTLVRNAGTVLTHQQLLKEVWGPNATQHTHYLRVYMTQLRHKLEHDPARPRYLLTEPGVGYRLRAQERARR